MVDYNKIILINEKEYKYCKDCSDLLPIDKFGKNLHNPTGHMLRCISCEIRKRRIKREENKIEWLTIEDILTGMGYDITDDIHKQFCDRHNLPYKEKTD